VQSLKRGTGKLPVLQTNYCRFTGMIT